MKQIDKLLQMIPKLDAVSFVGLARILKVELLEEVNPEAEELKDRYKPRMFSVVLDDLLKNFSLCTRARRREILALVKAATQPEETDAHNS